MSENLEPGNAKLWAEILKAIVDTMPEQLFPLFKEIYGKDYPKGTPVTLLATESSTYQDEPNAPPGSRLTDITLLVGHTDYYHLECQMRNEKNMAIRMFVYDLHIAMQHTASTDAKKGEVVIYFPRSSVIYPAMNRHIPDTLKCRIIFQDGSEHIYEVSTVKIQSYSLQDIREKHLNIFIPYVLLRLRPRLNPKRKHPLTKKELTDFVDEAILILKDELEHGYLTGQEFDDYINLFRSAAKKIFKEHPEFQKEVERMTKPLIELPSVREKRLRAELAEKEAELAKREAELAERDAELARLQELLHKYNLAT